MSDYIININLDEFKELVNKSYLPLRFAERTRIQSIFKQFCFEYDESMLPYINYTNFDKAIQINKKVRPFFNNIRESINSDLFFELTLYCDLDFQTLTEDFIVVFKDSLFCDPSLKKYQEYIYDQICNINDDALSSAEQLNEIKYSGLNIGPINRKTLLISLKDLKDLRATNFEEKILSNRLCISLRAENIKSYIKACYYKNEIVNINKIDF